MDCYERVPTRKNACWCVIIIHETTTITRKSICIRFCIWTTWFEYCCSDDEFFFGDDMLVRYMISIQSNKQVSAWHNFTCLLCVQGTNHRHMGLVMQDVFGKRSNFLEIIKVQGARCNLFYHKLLCGVFDYIFATSI